MSVPKILPLSEAADPELVGGKAVNLGRLIRAGLPVPDGFVITTAAWRSVPDDAVPPALAAAVREALDRLEYTLVAVRSSATAEDAADASMAGQFETYLNLETPEEVLAAIGKCRASARSDRTLAYLREHNMKPGDVAMAVVVQRLVAAETAGVLFTVDPKTGSRDHMLIEAAWGLGETVVSGEVQPDIIRVRADEPRIESYRVARKTRARQFGEAEAGPVPDEKQMRACLSAATILRLRDVGLQAVAALGEGQDIEWAVEDGTVYVLQARPITTLRETDAYRKLVRETKQRLSDLRRDGRGPWVRHNLGETLPHPTPFTWSLISRFMSGDGGFGSLYRKLGFEPGPAVCRQSFLERIGGEIYMDCSLMVEMFSQDYPFAYDVGALRENPDAAQQPPTVPNGGFRQMKRAARLAADSTRLMRQIAGDLDKTFDLEQAPAMLKWSRAQEAIALHSLDNDELIALWERQTRRVLDEFAAAAFLPGMVVAYAMERLQRSLEEHAWNDAPAELVARLAVSPQPDRTIAAHVALHKVATGEITLEVWLDEYGHRAPGEFELAVPRWSERPEDARRMAALLADQADPQANHASRLADAEAGLAHLRSSLRPAAFEEVRARARLLQRYWRFREDGKYYLMHAYAALRRTALEFGRRLNIGDDIFFLKPPEVLEALRTGFVPADRIGRRLVRYAVETRMCPPHVIGDEELESLGAARTVRSASAFPAHGVSFGTAQGPAAIVHVPEAVEEMPSGAILVCPSTDPSWTPLFAQAAGLVLERGGALSHGAVVAREMGLPAVVLPDATRLFEEGEPLGVDANAGCVYRPSAEAAPEQPGGPGIERNRIPPPPGAWESRANRAGLAAALFWGLFLAAVFLLPEAWLRVRVTAVLDALLWPLVRWAGMPGAVALVAVLFAVLPVLVQRFLTDNRRLMEAKRRARRLQKAANRLPRDAPLRKRLEALARPVSLRVLKAAMTPIAFVLGPMILIFLWMPDRVDPASWNPAPGRMVTIVAEVHGDFQGPVRLSVPPPMELDGATPPAQSLPPVRKELEALRSEWARESDLDDLPWEVRTAGEQARKAVLASLDAYLAGDIPPMKMTWLIRVPEEASGTHELALQAGEETAAIIPLAFGRSVPPAPRQISCGHPAVESLTVNYPRPLTRRRFWTPLKAVGGPPWDVGWLGLYLLVYLPLLFLAKWALRVP